MPESHKSISVAPGKVVLWGEYAILDGAPAVTMAVNRYAIVELMATSSGWEFVSSGFKTPGLHLFEKDFCSIPSAQFAELSLQKMGFQDFHTPFSIHSDTSSFYHQNKKIGLGSSASLSTATYHALATMLGIEASLETALEIHNSWQSGSGSGIDVATSWFGGTVTCQKKANLMVNPFRLPDSLHWQLVWTGCTSNTRDQIKKFDALERQKSKATLDNLCLASEQLNEGTVSLDALRHYKDCLKEFDKTGKLNIFTTEHQRLDRIAAQLGLVYKPCGAGGGDIGIAFANDAESLAEFNEQIEDSEFVALDMEIAVDGVKTT